MAEVKVRWTTPALADLVKIGEFIAQENPVAAGKVMEAIETSVGHLNTHPQLGRTGRVAGTFELVIPRYPFVAVYRLVPDSVEILTVVHTSRQYP